MEEKLGTGLGLEKLTLEEKTLLYGAIKDYIEEVILELRENADKEDK